MPSKKEPSSISERLDALVDAALEDGFAGGVVVHKPGDFEFSRTAGSADKRGRVPVSDKTLFHVASVSKLFTAVLVLRAAELGHLSLDDDLGVWLPDTRLATRGIRIADLLAHRSGLGSSYVAERAFDQDKAIRLLDNAPIDDAKKGEFRYSNDGYSLLAIVIERAYEQSFEEAGRTHIIAPLGLHASFWGGVELTDPDVVSQPLERLSRSLRKRNYGMLGASGLLITAADLAKFQRALLAGNLLNEASLAELIQPRDEISIGLASFGAFIVEHDRLGRVYTARGYEDWGDNAIVNFYLDHDLTIAVVTSRGPAEDSGKRPFRTSLSQAIEDLWAERKLTPP